ncbi:MULTISPECIES: M16 family metallopeptidase [Empedobacter]|uniref:M16 family metallopeptidase n=1 Tax=Empedobacter TaxID=59734 RepID=UPI00056EA284|nr:MULTISPECIES: M16 family metallopeptidase [Empedobacter]MDH1883542.1 insulinase family protein [Empedobacter sp. GD03797]
MRKSILICGIIFGSVFTHAQLKTVKKTDNKGYTYEMVENDPSNTRIYTLKNGLKIYLAQLKDEPRIQTHIAVKTGSNNDPEDNTGLAHYLEHMVFKGTSKIGTQNWAVEKPLIKQISDLYEQHKAEKDPAKKVEIYKKIDQVSQEASKYAVANEYDKLISSLGASGTNAHTSLEETIYHNNIPNNELEKWLKVESERFGELTLRLFHTELEAVYEEFNRAQDNDGRLVFYKMMQTLFPKSHYGTQTTIGTSEHLKNPSMVAIHNYFDKYYVASNMAVMLIGDFDFDTAVPMIDKYFGNYATKPAPQQYVAKEEPIKSIVTSEVFSPSSERVQFAYRFNGANSDDAKYVTLIDYILSNSTAGLIDLNINQQQKALGAGSGASFFRDLGMHSFSGTPKQGQSLEEVRDLILGQIENIKQGKFEDWMIDAVVNDLKKSRLQSWENSRALAASLYTAYINETPWSNVVSEYDDLSKITKQQLMDFAKKNYNNNYVIVYKRQGENKDLVRVSNPGITPIQLNRDAESQFYKDFQKIETKDIQPVFVDFKKELNESKVKNTAFTSIKNNTNDLSSVYYILDMGSDHNKKLGLAINYLNYLGTSKYSPEALKKEFYKLGVSYNVNSGTDRSFVYLTGLQKNLPEGIKLFEHLLNDAVANQQSYQEYVKTILKSRENSKKNKNAIAVALNNYAQYGENNRFRDIISEKELNAINPTELTQLIKNVLNYKHQIFYYGNDEAATKKALEQYHNFGKGLDYPAKKDFPQPVTDGKVYFAPYDMVQAEINFVARDNKFDKNLLTSSGIFNEYFGGGLSSIVFQEIRESKSLAYSARANYANAGKKDLYNYVRANIGTQANKLPQAVAAMSELMNNMPKAPNQFENSKQAALKQIATKRYTKSNIFFYWLSLQDRGLSYDINKDIYAQTSTLTLDQLNDFFNKHIKGQKYNVGLIGNKTNLDWPSVEKLGQVKELTLEDLFNY